MAITRITKTANPELDPELERWTLGDWGTLHRNTRTGATTIIYKPGEPTHTPYPLRQKHRAR
jgi:hypothetical protein